MAWRFQLMTLPDRAWVDRDVPLAGAEVTEALSGAAAIVGTLPAGYDYLGSLKEWGSMLVAQNDDGGSPVACIVDGLTSEGARMRVEAGGFSMYPTGMPWDDADYAGIQVDPLDMFRKVWDSLQSKPDGDLKVVVDSDKSDVRLGIPETPALTAAKAGVAAAVAAEASAKAAYNAAAAAQVASRVALLNFAGLGNTGLVLWQDSAPSGTRRSKNNLWIDKNDGNKSYYWSGAKWILTGKNQTTINSLLATFNNASPAGEKATWDARKKDLTAANKKKSDTKGKEADPFTLTWWENHDLGAVLTDLAKTTPFDYRERSAWDSNDNITHRIELGVPTLGARRDDLRFEVGVNVRIRPSLQEGEYASELILLGSGEGRNMVRSRVLGNGGRIRRAVVVQRKEVSKIDKAITMARAELASRASEWVFDSLSVLDNELAPYGSFRPGDEILVTGDAGWKQLEDWVRILEITTNCTTGLIDLKVEAT